MDDISSRAVTAILLQGIGQGVRLIAVAWAVFLVLFAILGPLLAGRRNGILRVVFSIATVSVLPVRRMLNREDTGNPYDFTPLAAAMLVLVLGLGVEAVVNILARAVLGR